MILHSVAMKNFMKHSDLTISFEPNMNILRSPNEGGKSTVLTAIAYNWFGASALPQSIDETVTWGAKKTSMKTTTKFSIGAADYVCKRSASGAELYKGDSKSPVVTGHKEVSSAIAELFDLPSVAAATKLLVANQNDVRGIISLGATASASFIEELIDMADVDDLIKDVSERLTYSSDAKKQVIASADAAAEQLAGLDKPVSTKKMENALTKLKGTAELENTNVLTCQENANETELAFRQHASTIKSTSVQITNLKNKLAGIKPKLFLPETTISDEEIVAASQQLQQNLKYNFYTNEFIPFVESSPVESWEGTAASLELYVKGLEEKKTLHQEAAVKMKMEMGKIKGMIINDIVCPTCGQDIQDKDSVEKNNLLLENDHQQLQMKVDSENADALEVAGLLKEAAVLSAFQHKQDLWVAKNSHWVEVNDKVIPNEMFMLGGNPTKPLTRMTQVRFNQLCQTRDKQAAILEAYDQNKTLCDGLESEISVAEKALLKLSEETQGLENARDVALADIQVAKKKLADTNQAKSDLQLELSVAVAENKALLHQKQQLTDDVEKFRAQAEDIQGNSDLISALRSARLEISSLLWRKLLGVTETYFSLFRGVPSTLDMSKKGILVDGHLSAPSGSTLDILGLALRLAMSKLFANNGLCILDEPSAGCDDERTAAMTAGLLSSGFDQVVLVTHKDVDESAGNLILI